MGLAAEHTNARMALLFLGLESARPSSCNFRFGFPALALTSAHGTIGRNPNMFEEHAADLGPVLVTVKYVIDPVKAPDFLE